MPGKQKNPQNDKNFPVLKQADDQDAKENSELPAPRERIHGGEEGSAHKKVAKYFDLLAFDELHETPKEYCELGEKRRCLV